jgi:hypothetical protein
MKEIDEIFDAKAFYNKWLLELKDYERELIKDMMYEAAQIALAKDKTQ